MAKNNPVNALASCFFIAVTTSSAMAATWTYTGASGSGGATDTWNIAARWDSATAPTGAVDAALASGKYVVVNNAATPGYTGSLTLGSNSTLQIGWTTTNAAFYNALGNGNVTMAGGSKLFTRNGGTLTINNLTLTGDAGIQLGDSTQSGAVLNLTSGVTGAHALSVISNTSSTINFNYANAFNALTLTHIAGRGDNGATYKANLAGSLGTGDVTIMPRSDRKAPQLWITASDALGDTGVLRINGFGPTGNGANRLNMGTGVTDTVGGLWLAGVKQISGTYTTAGLGAGWMTGTGTLTVNGPTAAHWDIDDSNPGAGGAAPSGTWGGANANWNADSTGSTGAGTWTSGQQAVFSAGVDATGTYTVTTSGVQGVGGLKFEDGNVTINGDGLQATTDLPVYVNSGRIATVATGISELSSGLSLNKTGGGTLELSSANTYTGATNVGDGVLRLSHANAIANSSGVLVTGGGLELTTAVSLKNITFDRPANFVGASGGTLAFQAGGSITQMWNSYNTTITSSITGSPTVYTYDGPTNNQYEGLKFEPAAGQTQTLGVIHNPMNTGSNDKAGVYLGGETTGNSVVSIDYVGGDRYGTVYKTGTSEWTVGNITTGTLLMTGGTLQIADGSTIKTDYNELKLGGGTLRGNFTVYTTNSAGSPVVYSGGTIAPGNSIGTIAFDWGATTTPAENTNTNPATGPSGNYSLTFMDGSAYEWEIGAGSTTDKIDMKKGALYLNNFTLKILDAGADTEILATDQLPVFTYAAGLVRDLSGFANSFDTSGLGDGWTVGTLQLLDDGNGTIYLTGLAYAVPEPSTLALFGLGGLLLGRRRR